MTDRTGRLDGKRRHVMKAIRVEKQGGPEVLKHLDMPMGLGISQFYLVGHDCGSLTKASERSMRTFT